MVSPQMIITMEPMAHKPGIEVDSFCKVDVQLISVGPPLNQRLGRGRGRELQFCLYACPSLRFCPFLFILGYTYSVMVFSLNVPLLEVVDDFNINRVDYCEHKNVVVKHWIINSAITFSVIQISMLQRFPPRSQNGTEFCSVPLDR